MAREIDYRMELEVLAASVALEADNFAADRDIADPTKAGRVSRLRETVARARGFLRAASLPPFEEMKAAE